MGPVAMLRPPPGTSSQTQPDGRSVYSVFALRLGQRGRLRGTLLPLSGPAVLRSPGAGRSGPQGIGFPHSSAHVRMNVGGVRMKLIIKASIANAIWFLKYGRIPRQEGKMVPTAAQVVESWAEPLLNEVGSSS